ncbi:hypothetical protein HZA86_00015 [Candidatus Uhrbacteria bacterium]|nr:hypothetical protein [Candidatus Uhrbacteria bacterium]
MLIEHLIVFLEEASQYPYFLWRANYSMARKTFLRDVQAIYATIDPRSQSGKTIASLVVLLQQPQPNESALAEGLTAFGNLFAGPQKSDPRLTQYQQLCAAFVKRVRMEESRARMREQMRHDRTLEEQQAYDTRLFTTEGLGICLLYFLMYYKMLRDCSTLEQKQALVLQQHINMGSGTLPNLKEVFAQDEILDKFIWRILNDDVREALTREYYWCKQIVLNAADYRAIEAGLYDFNYALLSAFIPYGPMNASDYFIAPYGSDTTVEQLLPKFSHAYAPS